MDRGVRRLALTDGQGQVTGVVSADDLLQAMGASMGALTKAIGMEVDAAALGGLRSKRYAMVLDNGKVTHFEPEPDGFGLGCSLSTSMVEKL